MIHEDPTVEKKYIKRLLKHKKYDSIDFLIIQYLRKLKRKKSEKLGKNHKNSFQRLRMKIV